MGVFVWGVCRCVCVCVCVCVLLLRSQVPKVACYLAVKSQTRECRNKERTIMGLTLETAGGNDLHEKVDKEREKIEK